jgi:HEAT repeat protein
MTTTPIAAGPLDVTVRCADLAAQRQEAFVKGLRAAQQLAWNLHKHHGREKATAYQAHEAIRSFADGAQRELQDMATRTPNANVCGLPHGKESK